MQTHFLLTTVLSLVLASSSAFAADADSKKPNILLIIADDLNDWIGPMGGHPQAKTPNLDKLAARGVTFRNAQCPAPLCNPSRTAFMSGMRPSTTGIYHNQQVWMPHIGRGLCINDYIRKFGYTSLGGRARSTTTATIARRTGTRWSSRPTTRCRTTRPTARPGPFGYRMFTEGEPQKPFEEKRAESKLVDAQSVSWCVERLGAGRSSRSSWPAACIARTPRGMCPRSTSTVFPLETIQLPAGARPTTWPMCRRRAGSSPIPAASTRTILEMGLWKDRVRAYLAAISYADAQIGRLLDALDKSPYRDNTIIVFVGDNGWHLGQKEHWGKVDLVERGDARADDLGGARRGQGRARRASRAWT